MDTGDSSNANLGEQLDYYRARAPEYDEWWLREGRYDRGESSNQRWFAEAEEVSKGLKDFHPSGHILELACGTGIWTEKLLPFGTQLTALDGSSEMLAINRARIDSPKVRYVEADVFDWVPKEKYDAIFFAFWLSHVPPEKFDAFWDLVRSCLAPGGRVFFVDSRRDPTSIAVDHRLPDSEESTVLRRRVNDGREFQIYKVFYDAAELKKRLGRLAWELEIQTTDHYFLFGHGSSSDT